MGGCLDKKENEGDDMGTISAITGKNVMEKGKRFRGNPIKYINALGVSL